jgi:hypothetical protein
VPLVHHQEVKEYNQSAGQVVEVVRTVPVLRKKNGLTLKVSLFLRKGNTKYVKIPPIRKEPEIFKTYCLKKCI